MIDVINRFGHCVSYNFVEELETELAFGAVEESKLLPESLLWHSDNTLASAPNQKQNLNFQSLYSIFLE